MEKLPLELVVQIFTGLPITDTWRLRCVSRSWQNTLTSNLAVSNAIRRHETHDPGDSALPPATSINEELGSRERLLKNHYMSSSLPTISITNPTRTNATEICIVRDMKGRFFATTISRERLCRVMIRDLVNNKEFSILADPYNIHNPIRAMCLTEDIVAFCSPFTLFTMRFSELSDVNYARRNRQEERWSPIDVRGHKDTVAILWKPQDQDRLAITIYEHDADRTQRIFFYTSECNIWNNPFDWYHGLLIDSDARICHLFSSSYDVGLSDGNEVVETTHHLLSHNVWTFDGECLTKNLHKYTVEVGLPPTRKEADGQPTRRVASIGIPHLYHFYVLGHARLRGSSSRPRHHLLLNLQDMKNVQFHVITQATGAGLAIWKDVAYQTTQPHDKLRVSRLSLDATEQSADVAVITLKGVSSTRSNIMVNDSFLIWTTKPLEEAEHTSYVLRFDARIHTGPISKTDRGQGADSSVIVEWTHHSRKV